MISIDLEKIELFGEDYISQHIISEYNKQNELRILKIYLTDSLKIITENTALTANGGNTFSKRYIDIVEPDNDVIECENPEEAAEQVISEFKQTMKEMREEE